MSVTQISMTLAQIRRAAETLAVPFRILVTSLTPSVVIALGMLPRMRIVT